jgi:hypothetical protein
MSDGTETHSGQNHDRKSLLGRTFDFVIDHPKTSMLLGAGFSVVAGAEILAAALVGGAITLVFTPRAPKS